MRLLILLLFIAVSTAVSAKNPPAASVTAFERISLFNGNVKMDMPRALQLHREYFHYWDNCPQGGYSVSFEGCSKKSGVNIQINIHDWVSDKRYVHDQYDPRTQCLKNARLLQDSTYTVGNKKYTVIATLATAGKRKGMNTNNYHLSYYIFADGRMLEFHYNYWGKNGSDVDYWKDVSYRVANSINWYSGGWATVKN